MKIFLIFPPLLSCLVPYPSIYYIKGFLRRHGYDDVVDLDLNLHMHHSIYRVFPRELRRIERMYASPAVGREADKRLVGDLIDRARRSSRHLKSAVDYFCRNSIRDNSSPQVDKYNSAIRDAAAVYNFSRNVALMHDYDLYASKDMLEFIANREYPYGDYYDAVFDSFKKKPAPDFVGISLSFEQQIHHAFAIAMRFKTYFPKTHVSMGGNYATRIITKAWGRPNSRRNLFQWVDSVVLHEAEHSISELIDWLSGRIKRLPPYVDVATKKFRSRPVGRSPHSDLFEPDYGRLDYRRYFNVNFLGKREKCLNFLATRGCSWMRCRFCASHAMYRGYRRCSNFSRLADVVGKYVKKFGIRYVRFNDEEMDAPGLSMLSHSILRKRLKFEWVVNIRADCRLDGETAASMRRAGCRIVLLGLESASPRVLRRMNKGIDIDQIDKLLKLLHNNGILAHLYVICFYPGETAKDLECTYKFIIKNKRYLYGISVMPFSGDTLAPIFSELPKRLICCPRRSSDMCTFFSIKGTPSRKMLALYSKILRLRDELAVFYEGRPGPAVHWLDHLVT